MPKIVKGLLKNLSLIAFTIGMIGAFITYDALKERLGANEELIEVDVESVRSAELMGKYVGIQGGVADILQTYEYGIGDLGDGEEMLASLFYYPVVLTVGGAPQFIVVSEEPPALGADDPTSRVGILKTPREIPDKVMDEFAAQYPDTAFVLLDTQYAPTPVMDKYINFGGFLLLILASLFVYWRVVRDAPKKEQPAQQNLSSP